MAVLAVSAVTGLLVAPDRGMSAGSLALALAPLLALPWRHRAPLATFAMVELLALGARVAFGPNGPADLVVLVVLYGVASRRGPRWAALAVAVDVMALGVTAGMAAELPAAELRNELLGQGVLGLLVVLFGMYVAARRAHLQALEDRAARLARNTELEARAAVDDERRRVARELHDVVAHHVSVMTLHAGALERQLQVGGAGHELVDTAGQMRTTGQEAMYELRHMLDVLRHDRDEDATAPQPTLQDLDSLVERMRTVGMPVALTRRGPLERVPAGMALTLHRIVQEALTNTLRHAGPVATEVALQVTEDAVELEVRDHGPAPMPPTYPRRDEGGGHGIAGMRERAALYAGEVTAGPHPEGGFRVHVRMPLRVLDG